MAFFNRETDDEMKIRIRNERAEKKRKLEAEWRIKNKGRIKKANEIFSSNAKLIVKFLKKEQTKLPASDIDFRCDIKNHDGEKDINYVKNICETLYKEGKIGRTANYRYFFTQSKISPKKSSKNIDIKEELKKLKSLLDEGLITKKQYEVKSNKLLGI